MVTMHSFHLCYPLIALYTTVTNLKIYLRLYKNQPRSYYSDTCIKSCNRPFIAMNEFSDATEQD